MIDQLPRFRSVEEMVRQISPSYPVYCLRPDRLKAGARAFIEAFPGTVLYAVKCNPHPLVLKALYQGGIRHFDAASLAEIGQVLEMFPDAVAYFHNPVKSRPMIETAYKVWGVRHFAVDCADELDKVLARAGRDREVVVVVRLATPPSGAVVNLSAKFGASLDEAVQLLRRAAAEGVGVGVSFHVGSQCREPRAYADGIALAGEAIRAAAVEPVLLDVGGGFPISYENSPAPPLGDFVAAIRPAFEGLGLGACQLIAEPGRALVAGGQSLVTQVLLRKTDRVYLNEGVYGGLMDLKMVGLVTPTRVVRLNGPLANDRRPFTVFGPTCDSDDILPEPWQLPADIREGDWIEIETLGAYSNAMATDFNGFITETFVEIAAN